MNDDDGVRLPLNKAEMAIYTQIFQEVYDVFAIKHVEVPSGTVEERIQTLVGEMELK